MLSLLPFQSSRHRWRLRVLALLIATASCALLFSREPALAAITAVNVGQQNGGTLGSTQFNAATISIVTGDTVHWDWFNGNHTVNSYDESSPGVPLWKSPGVLTMAGDAFEHTFATPGVYTYYCSIHGSRNAATPANVDANIAAGAMVGKIVVTTALPVGGVSSSPDALPPARSPNGLVPWMLAVVVAVAGLGAIAFHRRRAG